MKMEDLIGELHIMKVYPETIVDGPGFRYSIYLSGCRHHCPGCQNPNSWNPLNGLPLRRSMVDEMVESINENPILDGVTFSGGDPFFNPKDFGYILKRIKKETGKNIWVYTGYKFEELLEIEEVIPLLNYIDVIVDGRFDQSKFDPRLDWRGSSNQRLVKVQEELRKFRKEKKEAEKASKKEAC
jgi:anaerobic ribonucleoside-triphosphate reductase activating protein